MTTDRDVTRIVRSWLRTDDHESADRVLRNVLEVLDATPQRGAWWPARRLADMNGYTKLLIALAAVVVIAVAGLSILPGKGNFGGIGPAPTPSPSPSPTPSPTTAATSPVPLVSGMSMEAGTRYAFTVPDTAVPITVAVPTDGWSFDGFWFHQHVVSDREVEMYIAKGDGTPEIFTDPCAHTGRRAFQDSTSGGATALTSLAGVEVIEPPSRTTVAGLPATTVAISVPDTVRCVNTGYWLWWGPPDLGHPTEYPTWLGSKLRFSFVELAGGGRITVKAETRQRDPGADVEGEIQQVIDSIRFE